MKIKIKTLAQAFFDSFSMKTFHHANEVLEGLEAFFGAVLAHEALRDYLGHPQISAAEKTEKLKKILEASGVSPDAQSVLFFLIQHQRIADLSRVIGALRELRNQHFEVLSAEAVSAATLGPEHEAHLKTTLQKSFGVKTVELDTQVDPEVLGGVVVRAGGQVLDATLKTKLKTIQLALQP